MRLSCRDGSTVEPASDASRSPNLSGLYWAHVWPDTRHLRLHGTMEMSISGYTYDLVYHCSLAISIVWYQWKDYGINFAAGGNILIESLSQENDDSYRETEGTSSLWLVQYWSSCQCKTMGSLQHKQIARYMSFFNPEAESIQQS